MEATFWGVRGSIATPERANLRFGGNTPCVEVRRPGDPPIVLDAGTGIRALSAKLVPENHSDIYVFLTHFHWDHIQGLPFFGPVFHKDTVVHIHSTEPVARIEKLIDGQMVRPYFPVGLPKTDNRMVRVPAKGVEVGAARVMPFALRHSDRVSGYRVDAPEGSVVYATDHEHGDPAFDDGLIAAADGADLMIYDSHYTPEEYPRFEGWGHSTWRDAIRIARSAGVKKLALFHHAPHRTDAALKAIVAEARKEFPATIAAQERLTVRIAR